MLTEHKLWLLDLLLWEPSLTIANLTELFLLDKFYNVLVNFLLHTDFFMSDFLVYSAKLWKSLDDTVP